MALLLSERTRPGAPIGSKGDQVRWLRKHGFRIPETWVIPAGIPLEEALAVETWLPDDGPWVVRFSASVDEGPELPSADHEATVLDVRGSGEVADAVRLVLDSAGDATTAEYRERGRNSERSAAAVMVQRMVTSKASGVAFSRNPTTGLNEVVIEAVEGRADALIGEGVSPERWIERWGTWSTRPDGVSVLTEDVAGEIAAETVRAAGRFGAAVDLEWVWDGDETWWLQIRPIAGLDDVSVYSNRISREVMPGMIKPLVWSVNVPVVNQAWITLFSELIGPNDLQPELLAKQFAYRAYFNMGTIGEIFELVGMPRDGLEMLLGLSSESKPRFRPSISTLRHLPRMSAAVVRKARYSRTLEAEIDTLRMRFSAIAAADLEALSDSGLLSMIEELAEVATRAAYANIVTPLLANLYVAFLRRSLSATGIDPGDLDLDLGDPANPYNPNPALDRLGRLIAEAGDDTVDAVRSEGRHAVPDHVEAALTRFLDEFGHLSDSGNDFSVPRWSEQPDAVLNLAVDHAEVEGHHRVMPWSDATRNLSGAARWRIRLLQRRASEFVDHREHVSFVYTFGYGLFRQVFHEIGRRLVERGLIASRDDVMYLRRDEVGAALLGGLSTERPPDELVAQRKEEMADLTDVALPDTIFGDDFVPARRGPLEIDQVTGVATSRGRHRGTLRIVSGIEDSPRVESGDVIAIPFSDVGWTPLFARAGAVIAESGGMLSHSSIVAREYRIPCVVSVAGATQLPDGATVVVDGYTGTVTIERTD